jgi:hypothetical protein
MGSGDIGSNGSVYWQITYVDGQPPDHVDFDSIDHSQIGEKKGHKGKFRITARYATPGDAAAALANAKVTGRSIQLDVDVRAFQKPVGPSNAWEIKIDW